MRIWLSSLVLLATSCALPPVTIPVYPKLEARPSEVVEPDDEVLRTGRLPRDVHPRSYQLRLTVDPEKERFSGETRIEVALDRARQVVFLHSKGLTVSRARVVRPSGESFLAEVAVIGDTGLLSVKFPKAEGPGLLRIDLTYDAPFGTRLTGLYRVVHAGASYAFTQHEAVSARESFPCFDEPRFKTPFDVILRVPKGQAAIANTRETARTARADGFDEVAFARTEKLPTYLLAFAVGPFDVVDGPTMPPSALRARELPIRGITPRGRAADITYALRETPRVVAALEAYTDSAYPFDKLDLIAVPDFAAGAMENAGAITFRDSLILMREDADEGQKRRFADVNAHELAHQWFGNLVTMPWWDDVWLNEAFATWMGTRVLDELEPSYQTGLSGLLAVHGAMGMDSQAAARRIREPVANEHDIDNAFDPITYQKGGAVLRMFEAYLGADAFRAGVRRYLHSHAFGNATADDFIAAESLGHPELRAAFRSFLDQSGVPILSASLRCDAGRAELHVSQARYAPLGSSLSPEAEFHTPFCVRYPLATGTKTQCTLLAEKASVLPLRSHVEARASTLALDTEGACPAWLHPNADARGYYRYALDGKTLAGLIAARAELSTRERLSLVANVDAALRSGALFPRDGLPALLAMLADPERQVLEGALGSLRGLREALVSAEDLPAYRALIAQALRPRFSVLGVAPKPGTTATPDEKLLRAVVVRALAMDAEDAAVITELARRGRDILARPEVAPAKVVPSELLGVALWAHLQREGATAFSQLTARLADETDGFVRGRVLSAVVQSSHPELTQQVLSLSLDEHLRVNERLGPVFGQLGRRETRTAAYAWVKHHFDALVKAVSGHGGSAVLGAVGSFCTGELAEDAQAFFGPKAAALKGGPRELTLALEHVRLCAALAQASSAAAHEVWQRSLPKRGRSRAVNAKNAP